jgi:carbon monoxide dehydrogenase subunit G
VKFEHQLQLGAPATAVRAFFDDVPSVVRCIPDVDEVTEEGDDRYTGRVRVRLGPIRLALNGNARLTRPDADTWRLEGEGRDSRVRAGAHAVLTAQVVDGDGGQSEVHIDADIQFSGRLAEIGQPLIRRKAEAMVREFAENVEQQFQD